MKEHIWEHIGEHTEEPAQQKRARTGHKSHFVEICRKNAGPIVRARHFAPAKSKRTWTFFRDLRFVRACAFETHMDISEEPFYVAAPASDHLD